MPDKEPRFTVTLPSESTGLPKANSTYEPPQGLLRGTGETVRETIVRSMQEVKARETPSENKGAQDSDRNFYAAITIYGGAFATGLYLFGDNPAWSSPWWYGLVFWIAGGVGCMSVTPLCRNKFPNIAQAAGAPRALWAAAIVVWLTLAVNLGFSVYGHFWPRPFTIGVSPMAGPAPTPPEPETSRVYTDKTVADLFNICAGRTGMQCDVLTADQKGKWVRTSGQIQSVGPAGEMIAAVIAESPAHLVSCTFSKNWRDRLGMLKPFEAIKIIGKIGQIQSGAYLTLEDCELRD